MSKKKGTAGKFVLGAAVGAAIGFLFSPKSGKENRKMVMDKATELINKAKELEKEEVRAEIEAKAKKIIEEIKDLDKEKVLKIAKKKALELKSEAEKLVQYAKDKATPIVEETAEALRKKAIVATESVLKKLEKEDK